MTARPKPSDRPATLKELMSEPPHGVPPLPEEFGPRLAALRKRNGLTQVEFGDSLGISQARISRLEKDEDWPTDVRLVAEIAKAFKLPVYDFVPEASLERLFGTHEQTQFFYAFCPNPFCPSNKHGKAEGSYRVWWSSGQSVALAEFDHTNFCKSCGTRLVKDCPSCSALLDQKGQRYCGACGAPVTERPTPKEWQRIEDECKAHEALNEDEIPF